MSTTGATRASGVSIAERCVISALNFFDDPFKERAIENTYTCTSNPIAAISPSSTCVEFQLPGSSDFLSPRHTLIDVTFRILNEDGSKLAPDAADKPNQISCIQCPAYSLWKSVEIKLSNEIVSNSYANYHLAAYFMVNISYLYHLIYCREVFF